MNEEPSSTSENRTSGPSNQRNSHRIRWRVDPSSVREASWGIILGVLVFTAVYFVLAWSKVDLIRSVSNPVTAATGGLVTATLLIYIPLLLITIAGLILWAGGLQPADIGLTRGDLPIGIAVTVVAWVLIQLGVVLSLLNSGDPVAINEEWYVAGVLVVLGPLVAQLLGNALFEEVVMRGFLLVQVHKLARRYVPDRRRSAFVLALVGSQLVFGLLHIPNRLAAGASGPQLVLGIVLPSLIGMLLALVFYRTGNLFIAIGLHAFMNYPTLLVDPQGLGETYAIFLALVVAVGWPWLAKAATALRIAALGTDDRFTSD